MTNSIKDQLNLSDTPFVKCEQYSYMIVQRRLKCKIRKSINSEIKFLINSIFNQGLLSINGKFFNNTCSLKFNVQHAMLWPDTHGPLDIYELANSRQCKSIRSKMLINTTNIIHKCTTISLFKWKTASFLSKIQFKIKLTSVKFSTKWRPALITMPLYMTTGRLYKLLSMRSE